MSRASTGSKPAPAAQTDLQSAAWAGVWSPWFGASSNLAARMAQCRRRTASLTAAIFKTGLYGKDSYAQTATNRMIGATASTPFLSRTNSMWYPVWGIAPAAPRSLHSWVSGLRRLGPTHCPGTPHHRLAEHPDADSAAEACPRFQVATPSRRADRRSPPWV